MYLFLLVASMVPFSKCYMSMHFFFGNICGYIFVAILLPSKITVDLTFIFRWFYQRETLMIQAAFGSRSPFRKRARSLLAKCFAKSMNYSCAYVSFAIGCSHVREYITCICGVPDRLVVVASMVVDLSDIRNPPRSCTIV